MKLNKKGRPFYRLNEKRAVAFRFQFQLAAIASIAGGLVINKRKEEECIEIRMANTHLAPHVF